MRLVSGSMRASSPFMSVSIQMLSPLAVSPPSLSAGPIGMVALTLFVFGSMRCSALVSGLSGSPQIGTQMLPKASTSPEHGRGPVSTSVTTVLVFGSRRPTRFLRPLVTHTASLVTTCQSGLPGTGNTPSGLSTDMSRFTPGAVMPGRGGRAGCAGGSWASSSAEHTSRHPPAMVILRSTSDSPLHRLGEHRVTALLRLPRQQARRDECTAAEHRRHQGVEAAPVRRCHEVRDQPGAGADHDRGNGARRV